jgi:hypothetical protein
MKRPARVPSQLPASLHRRLNAYALVASAAGVGLLALSQPAESKIVYTSAHKHIGPHQKFALDLNHDGRPDFAIKDEMQCGTDICFTWLAGTGARGNSVLGYSGGLRLASSLKRGSRIGPRGSFYRVGDLVDMVSGADTLGAWVNVSNRYLGLRFKIHGHTHYGWARLNVTVNGRTITGTLTGYAYETVPNKPIIAGKTKGSDAITVQPSSLGHLATGASAIPAWRVKRTAATSH